MHQFEFRVPATVFVQVTASSLVEAQEITARLRNDAVDVPQPPFAAAQVVSVIVDAKDPMALNTVDGEESWNEASL